MSTQLFFSHRIESLAERLAAEVVRAVRLQPDPFKPLMILVPNNAIKRYLQLTIAEQTGITANIRFLTFQHGLGERLKGGESEHVQLLEMDNLRMLTAIAILRHIRQPTPTGRALDALSYMLYDTSGNPAKNFAARLWQISGQLSHYLTEYEFHRQDMVQGWCSDPPVLSFAGNDSEAVEMEECQRMLYLTLFGDGGLRDELEATTGLRALSLPQLAAETSWPAIDETICIFGLSQVSSFHRSLLFSLGNVADLKVFQLNVCSEFWEDISTDHEDRWRRLKQVETTINDAGDEELEWDDNENMLLKWWGKPGREHIRLLSDLETMVAHDLSVDTVWLDTPEEPSAPTVLSTLQHQILHREQLTSDQAIPQDRSLQVFGAPGIFREVETIYQNILFNLKEDPDLKQTEIAVLVPDINLYKPAIHAVFQRQPRRLGFNLTDASAGDESIYSQALLSIIDLVKGNFSRKQVFDLLRNPCMLKGCGINRREVQTWIDWCDKLNIFHDFDAAGLSDNPRYTWQQGLRRLRLGRLMSVPESKADHSGPFGTLVPYADMESGDYRNVQNFSVTIEALFRETAVLAEKDTTLSEWYTSLEHICDRFLGIPDNHDEERVAHDRLFSQLRDHLNVEPLFAGHTVGIDFIREIITSCLQGIPSRHGSYLSGGVTISAIKINRPVPFKVVYMAGLGEGKFPGQADLSTLNLRNTARKLGDISRPEEDRFSILETLMGCKHKLYLSYVNRDLQKDQDFYPCSIIVQLLNYIEQSITNTPYDMARIPVDTADSRFLNPAMEHSAFDLFVNYSEHDRAMSLKSMLALSPDRLHDADIQRVNAWLSEHAPAPFGSLKTPEAKDVDVTEPVEFNERVLRDFLDNPLEASLKHKLQIYQYGDDEPDKTLIDDEPFYSPIAVSREIMRTTLQRAVQAFAETAQVRDSGQVTSLFSEVYETFYYESSTPEGVFCDIDRHSLLDRVLERYSGRRNRGLADTLTLLSHMDYQGDLTVGPASNNAGSVLKPTPMSMPDGSHLVLTTTIPGLWFDRTTHTAHHVYLTHDKEDHRDFPFSAKLFTPFLSYLIALTAQKNTEESSWWDEVKAFTIHWSNANKVTPYTYSVTPDAANEYLQSLCHDNHQRPFDMLPYSVLYSLSVKRSELPIPLRPGSYADPADKARYVRRLEREIMDLINNPWSTWYSSRLLKLLDYTVPKDAWDTAHRRFSLFHAGSKG